MDDMVTFFAEDVTCQACGKDTQCYVIEHSGTINCTECDAALLDFTDVLGDTVVVLQLEDGTVH